MLEEGNANPNGFGVIAHLQNEEENGNAQRAIARICPGRTNLPVLQLGVSTKPTLLVTPTYVERVVATSENETP